MHEISLSAKLIRFPRRCCCCGAADAANKYEAIATRTSGKRVVRTDSRSWSFPICSQCLEWVRAKNVAKALSRFLLLVVLGMSIALYVHYSNGADSIFPEIIGVASVAALFFIWRRFRAKANHLKRNSGCRFPPVQYLGWQGTVHTFILTNSDFTTEFQHSNEKKLVG
jgi:hypothetical protein